MTRVGVRPLSQDDVVGTVADALGLSPDDVRPLAEIVHRRASGNPFLVGQILRTLYNDRLLTRSGTAYLALELRDRTGSLPARAFKEADSLGDRFERGDLVRVAGRAQRFRDEQTKTFANVLDGFGFHFVQNVRSGLCG